MTTLGVFDSGVGGLSVLRELQKQLPTVSCVYVADSAFAPYGERDVATIQARAQTITTYLRLHHGIKALVIACNTATAHAVEAVRATHPDLPIIGVEPALKPAAAQTVSGHVGILATRGTLSSERFLRLRTQVESSSSRTVHFWPQACDGLADAIERNRLEEVQALGQRYMTSLFNAGPQAKNIDTIVLGCTHYPFALETLQSAALGHGVRFLETGLPVARRARELLVPMMPPEPEPGLVLPPTLFSTGDATGLSGAAQRWIDPKLFAHTVSI
ncbi:hypothetical protein LPB72_12020 [Hydrogenophaga crassostreae]|uniref:Glutamate racemase n=1 Tax=Hydrogenophaga crassostreae TaxID=1763535 RepID=A0A167I185_9BURK|nr:glutamate racemase [Hydrogenophaga crassostreae]AOW13694.1 glutamate racemase [Hydrogenophaga crassostreae]OAD41990.1 hypothetical protein LPB72_12020 [Hydrogenophaga crassostreae]